MKKYDFHEALLTVLQRRLDDLPVQVCLVWLVDHAPADSLDYIARDLNLSPVEWHLCETIEAKRELVKNAFELNQKKGTAWALERVLEILDLPGEIIEGFEPDGAGRPFFFTLLLPLINKEFTATKASMLYQLIDTYKRKVVDYELKLISKCPSELKILTATRITECIRFNPVNPVEE